MDGSAATKNKRISAKKVKGLVLFQLSNWPIYISTAATLLVNLIIVLTINLSTEDGVGGGSIDFAMLAVGIVFGVFVAALGLKFSMVNGASRKTYFLSTIITIFIAALAYSLVTFLAMLITHAVGYSTDAYYLLYGQGGMNWGGVIFFELCAMFFAMTLGFFAALVVYRTKKRGKLILLVAAVLLSGAVTLLGFFTDFWAGLGNFFIKILGLGFETPNPFIGGLSLFGIAAVLFAIIFPIVRRADIRE